MIFVTVGTQLEFPRLIDAMEAWAAAAGEPVVAQTGEAAAGRWPNLEVHAGLAPDAFGRAMTAARLVVGHAGIGTILSARQYQRPLVIMPRRASLGEHRNDHQLATARQLEARAGLAVAWEAEALARFLEPEAPVPVPGGDTAARDGFLENLALLLSS